MGKRGGNRCRWRRRPLFRGPKAQCKLLGLALLRQFARVGKELRRSLLQVRTHVDARPLLSGEGRASGPFPRWPSCPWPQGERREEEALRTTHLSIHPPRVSQTGRRERERKREKDPIALREKYLACTFIMQLSGQYSRREFPFPPVQMDPKWALEIAYRRGRKGA